MKGTHSHLNGMPVLGPYLLLDASGTLLVNVLYDNTNLQFDIIKS